MLGGSLMHLMRNMMSWSSSQYMRGSKWSEKSLDLYSEVKSLQINFVALRWTLSRHTISLIRRGLHIWEQNDSLLRRRRKRRRNWLMRHFRDLKAMTVVSQTESQTTRRLQGRIQESIQLGGANYIY